jgi:AraC-like DNA-binding protein
MVDLTYGRIRDLNGLPELVVQKAGEDALQDVFARQSLSTELLKDPQAVIPMKDLILLYCNAAEVCAIRSFGLEAAKDVKFDDYGAFGGFVTQAPTLRRALLRLQKVLPFYESGSRVTLQEFGNEFIVSYENIYQNMVGFRHAGDMTIRLIEGLIRYYLGENWHPLRVVTCCAKGIWEQDYEDAFASPAQFRAEKIALVLDREYVDQEKHQRDVALGELVGFADIVRHGQDLPDDFVGAVAKIIEMRLPTGKISLEDTADTMVLGPRTLQRRLDDHGVSYRYLVKWCRMRRARELLSGTEERIERISRELGYSTTSHFTRAFSIVYDVTPTEFRKTQPPELGSVDVRDSQIT